MNSGETLDILSKYGHFIQKKTTEAKRRYASFGGTDNRDALMENCGKLESLCTIAGLLHLCTPKEMLARTNETAKEEVEDE